MSGFLRTTTEGLLQPSEFSLVCCWPCGWALVPLPLCVVRPLCPKQPCAQPCPRLAQPVCSFARCLLLCDRPVISGVASSPFSVEDPVSWELLCHLQFPPLPRHPHPSVYERQSAQWLKAQSPERGHLGLNSTFASYHHRLLMTMTLGKWFSLRKAQLSHM